MPKLHSSVAAADMSRKRIKLHPPRAGLELIGLGILLLIVIIGVALKSVLLSGAGA